jgi:hypothetical protein
VLFHILDIVELWCQWILDIDDNNFPVGLLFIEQSHDAEDLDLLNVAWPGDEFSNFANVERVVVTLGLGLGVNDVGVFPCLVVRVRVVRSAMFVLSSYLREGTVVPEIAFVWEAVADESKLALLDVLLDGIEFFLLGDLVRSCQY